MLVSSFFFNHSRPKNSTSFGNVMTFERSGQLHRREVHAIDLSQLRHSSKTAFALQTRQPCAWNLLRSALAFEGLP
jgi:hypothetical protein